jgi:hypothetical protein
VFIVAPLSFRRTPLPLHQPHAEGLSHPSESSQFRQFEVLFDARISEESADGSESMTPKPSKCFINSEDKISSVQI